MVNGQTALILAVISGDGHVVERLLSKGVDANHRDKSGQTALMYAGIQNMPEVLEPLLPGSRVDLNIRNHSRTAPCSIASWHGDHFMAAQLFEYSDIDANL